MSEQVAPSLEDQLLDAQMHVGRLENELALALKGIAPELRWTTMRPAMSGLYLNCDDPVHGPDRIVNLFGGMMIGADGWPLDEACGPYWAGPLKIGAPE